MVASDLRAAQPIEGVPSVSVVIVTYRGLGFVSTCLDHVAAQTYTDAEVVLVENGSKDGTEEMVRERYPWVRLIVSPTNTGFTGGVNLGVSHARADRVALLNNDGHPEPRWLEELVSMSDRAARADLVSSVIKNVGMGDLEDRYGWTLNVLGRSHRHRLTPPDFLFFGARAGMLFSKTEYNPPFPEFYFIYNEDTYLGWLARLRGHDVHVSLKSRVIHEGSTTMKKMHAIGAFNGEKNRLTNNLVFWERRTLYKLTPLLALDVLFHLRRYPVPLMRALAWVLWNRRSIRRMRDEIQRTRKVPDAELLRYVSSQVKHGEGREATWANAFSAAYCRALGITTLESANPFSGSLTGEPAGRPSGAPLA